MEVIYINELNKNGIAISMGLTAYDNAYAERINGTIKNEYLKRWHITTLEELKKALKKAVTNYNETRKQYLCRRAITVFYNNNSDIRIIYFLS